METIQISIEAPGCKPIEVPFTVDSEPRVLELDCTSSSEEVQEKPAPPGATVEVRGGALYLEKEPVSVPVGIERLTEILGPPTEFVPARGDAYSNDVYEWEGHGVYVFARPGSSQGYALVFVLDPSSNNRHWCSPGIARLRVNGISIKRDTTATKLSRAGFVKDDVDDWERWEQRVSGAYFALHDMGEPPRLYEMEVGVDEKTRARDSIEP